MGLGWYNAHSRALNAYLMYEVTGNRLYRFALRLIERKFWFNPDIQALYQLTLPREKRDKYMIDMIYWWLEDYTDEFHPVPKEWLKWYFNIENFFKDGTVKTYYCDRILSSKYRKTTYDWSKKMIKPEYHENATPIDWLHLYHLWRKLVA
jgi:hypothetical protein